MTRIAIIGAGIAGLGAARLLASRDCQLRRFDKGRRAGGRLASREGEFGSFDHGLQFVRLDDEQAAHHGGGLLRRWDEPAPG